MVDRRHKAEVGKDDENNPMEKPNCHAQQRATSVFTEREDGIEWAPERLLAPRAAAFKHCRTRRMQLSENFQNDMCVSWVIQVYFLNV